MKKLLFIFISNIILYAGSCYSILTQTGTFTPVYPYNFLDLYSYRQSKCTLLDKTIMWDNNLSYVGCYKTYKEANYTLHHLKFNFKNPKIIKHKVSLDDKYIIFPNNSNIKTINIDKLLKPYQPNKILKKFPKKFYGDGITFKELNKITFLPTVNSYAFYKYYKKHHLSTKIMILYNGVYSIDYLYKKINNSNIIQKINNHKYILKTAIYISPTAKLVIKNKTILLDTTPKPVFIAYHGDLYAKNSKFITWNLSNNSYDKREHIPEEELLLIGKQKPRPYFIGLSNSKTYFINNSFRGLGFHSTSATFGVSLFRFPKLLILNQYNLFSYLSHREWPKGILIGNTMYHNMMGFYCSEIKHTALIGNVMYDNLIYNIDPHDYSEHLIIARNITAKANHAHGIVISRQVDHTIIAQNISFNNHSAGIMLDRLSNNNLIYDNLSVLNGYMGISIQESDNNLISKNILIGNKLDGVIIRNSLRNSIKNNIISNNAKNGIEIITKNIDDTVYRNFNRDPYHKATSAVVEKNNLKNNYLSNITVKNNAAVYLKQNKLSNKYSSNYAGDLNPFLDKIQKNNGTFKLYGIGKPFRKISSDLIKMNFSTIKTTIKIFLDASCQNNFISDILSKIFIDKLHDYNLALNSYVRGVSSLNKNDMLSFAFYKLSQAKTKEDHIDALSYLAQSVIFGNKNAKLDLSQIIYISPVTKEDINKAFEKAINRLKNYQLIDKKYMSACNITERKKAKIESTLKVFEYNFKHSNIKDYYTYCNLAEENFTIFTPLTLKSINYIFHKANEPKKAYYRKLLKDNEIIKENQACKLISLRQKRIQDSLQNYYTKEHKNIIKSISPYFDSYLNKINQYRIKKITKKQLLKLMENQ